MTAVRPGAVDNNVPPSRSSTPPTNGPTSAARISAAEASVSI